MSFRKEPRRYSRLRLFLYRLSVTLFSIGHIGRRIYSHFLKKGVFDTIVQRHSCAEGAASFRVVQLSDFHAGPFLNARSLQDVIEEVNRLEPHVLAITGDFITYVPEEIDELIPALSRIKASCAAFAVFGNHDYRFRREGYMQTKLEQIGIKVLRNQGVDVPFKGRIFSFLGIEDIEEGKYPDLDKAYKNLDNKGFKVLLSHNPDVVDCVESTNVDLILSGHTHGGQIVVPGIRALGSGYRGGYVRGAFMEGPHLKKGTDLYVNRGIGALVLPLRIRANAEITLHLLPLDPVKHLD